MLRYPVTLSLNYKVLFQCLIKRLIDFCFSPSPSFFQLDDNLNVDSPSYTFTKLDPANPEDKKKINDYLLWPDELTYDGKVLDDGFMFVQKHL